MLVTSNRTRRAVERRIHVLWFGGRIPGVFLLRCLRWRELNPDYEVRLWVDAPRQYTAHERRILDGYGVDLAHYDLGASPFAAVIDRGRPRNGGAETDVARHRILADHGGVYTDIDMIPERPLGALTPRYGFYIGGGGAHGARYAGTSVGFGTYSLGNDLLAGHAGHPLFDRLAVDIVEGLDDVRIEAIHSSHGPTKKEATMAFTGPGAVNEAVEISVRKSGVLGRSFDLAFRRKARVNLGFGASSLGKTAPPPRTTMLSRLRNFAETDGALRSQNEAGDPYLRAFERKLRAVVFPPELVSRTFSNSWLGGGDDVLGKSIERLCAERRDLPSAAGPDAAHLDAILQRVRRIPV